MQHLPLPLHLSIHFVLAVIVGWFIGRRFNKTALGITAGLLGGFFIDLDHILEYFLVFGSHFNIVYFLEARQFLASGRIHIWFHAWEYAPILFLAAWLVRKNKAVTAFILALALGGFIHLVSDCVINQFPPRDYSLLYRWRSGFAVEKLFSPEQYQEFLENKKYLNF
jgi:hypothetical protein